jgi:hypothetical protein
MILPWRLRIAPGHGPFRHSSFELISSHSSAIKPQKNGAPDSSAREAPLGNRPSGAEALLITGRLRHD